jgi:hypothetical protein
VAADTRIDETVRRAAGGDAEAARVALPEIREALPAAARGALDHAETLRHLEDTRPAAASMEQHELATIAAHRAIEDREAFPGFEPDARQVERIVEEIHGPRVEAVENRAQSLVEFLKARGGLLDQGGELKAIGAERLAAKPRGGKGRNVDRRVPLDAAREAAEEAGYIGRPGETQTTTVADLLDAIDQEMRGNRVWSREDAPDMTGNAEAALARLDGLVHEIARHAGPAVDDRIIREAAELALRDGLDAFDALESVLVRMEDAPQARGRTGDVPPGWSDDELLEAAAARGPAPDPEGNPVMRDPGEYPDEYAISKADLEEFAGFEIPDETGRVVPIERYMEDITREEELATIIKACRA